MDLVTKIDAPKWFMQLVLVIAIGALCTGAAFGARDSLRREIADTNAATVQAMRTERVEALKHYISRDELWQRLERLENKIDALRGIAR